MAAFVAGPDAALEAVRAIESRDSSTGAGPLLRDRRWHLRTFKNCLLGSETVTHLVDTNFAGVKTREDAVALMRLALELNLIAHVSRQHHFNDAYLFYNVINTTQAVDTALTVGTLKQQAKRHGAVMCRERQPATKGLFSGWSKKFKAASHNYLVLTKDGILHRFASEISDTPLVSLPLQSCNGGAVVDCGKCQPDEYALLIKPPPCEMDGVEEVGSTKTAEASETAGEKKKQKERSAVGADSLMLVFRTALEQEAWINDLVGSGLTFEQDDSALVGTATSLFEFTAVDIDGNQYEMAQLQGSVCLVVNVASE